MNTALQTPNTGSGLKTNPEQLNTDTNRKPEGNGTRHSVYDQITERITSLLAQGTVPWHKPWNAQTSLPRNLISKRPYRGINVFLLLSMHYESPFWLTYRQATELGGNVRKGEKACPVVFWKQLAIDDDDDGEQRKIPLLRFYYVFNVAQCEGLKTLPSPTDIAANGLTKPAEIVERMPQCPAIKHGMTKGFYAPSEDFVGMPNLERFATESGYFATLFHELIHSTGHASRLNRSTIMESDGFGSNPYCKEELIAEMGAAFLCGRHCGTDHR